MIGFNKEVTFPNLNLLPNYHRAVYFRKNQQTVDLML